MNLVPEFIKVYQNIIFPLSFVYLFILQLLLFLNFSTITRGDSIILFTRCKNHPKFYPSFFIFIIFLGFHTMLLYPQENIYEITAIEVIGLKRTKPYVAEYPLEKFLGLERSAFDPNEVFAVVKDTGILEPISAELIETEDDLILRVTVLEKWTFFPLPLIIFGSGEANFGLFLLDTNAFGQRDIAAIGGAYGSYGWSAITFYSHTPKRNGLPGWNGMFMYGRQERKDADRDEKIHRRYSTDQLRFSLGLNYLFMELITGSITLSYSDISLKNNDDILNPPNNGATHLSVNPGLSLRNSSWDGFFLSQRSISMIYSYNYAISGSSFHQLEFRGTYEQSLVPGFRLNIRSGGVWKSTSDPLFEEGPQIAQVAILPRNFSARHYAGFSTGLEKHLYKARWGTLSIQGSWQGIFSYGPISDFEFNHGPAGGLNFYLSRLALPAIGGVIAYNINSGLFQLTFNMGMSL